jgi:hypothetical protein
MIERASIMALLLILPTTGCQNERPNLEAVRSSLPAPSAPPARSAPSGSAAAASNALASTWTGSYDARHHAIEMSKKEGAVRDWSEDDGKLHSGTGKIALTIGDDGAVTGSSTGALGELVVAGELDGDTLRLKLTPRDPGAEKAFFGTLIAKRSSGMFVGKIQASSGDSLTVRNAPVELRPGTSNPAVTGGSGSAAPASSAQPERAP